MSGYPLHAQDIINDFPVSPGSLFSPSSPDVQDMLRTCSLSTLQMVPNVISYKLVLQAPLDSSQTSDFRRTDRVGLPSKFPPFALGASV